MKTDVKSLAPEELRERLGEYGIPAFRAKQITEWLYARGARSYDEMTNLPKAMRAQLAEAFPLYIPDIMGKQVSKDGTRKYLLEFTDGVLAETVGLPSQDGRLTVCCSSQAGCAMGCDFCATGKQGLARSLSVGEIADQISVVSDDFGERVTNVVVMGQGEPFANYDNVLAALRIMNSDRLMGIGARHITVSTCGLVSGIKRFSQEPEQFTLAVSLHAAIQETRDRIMPGVRKQPLTSLRRVLADYTGATGRRVSFEYALIKGVNDDQQHLHALEDFCRGLLCHVNLIPLNEVPGSQYRPVTRDMLDFWRAQLEGSGVTATVRRSMGPDIAGACGQLANTR